MPIELLKKFKRYFELCQKRYNEENEQLRKLYEDKQVLNYLNLNRNYFEPHVIKDFYFAEDVMDIVLFHHRIDKKYDNFYIDTGLCLTTATDPCGLGSTSRLIKESDLLYINNVIDNNTNPLINQTIYHDYVGLESGHCISKITYENKTIIKLPSLLKKESEITLTEDYKKIDWPYVNAAYLTQNDEYLSRLRVLRAQYFLRMIEENPEEVIAYYKNIENWAEIEENIDKYYLKKKKDKEKVYTKIQNL